MSVESSLQTGRDDEPLNFEVIDCTNSDKIPKFRLIILNFEEWAYRKIYFQGFELRIELLPGTPITFKCYVYITLLALRININVNFS